MSGELSGPGQNVTVLLQAWQRGDRAALDTLMPLVYQELHRLAVRQMAGESRSHTLQSTALVHEAFLRLVGQRADWQSRAHFFGIAATVMRRILVDHARRAHADRRGHAVPPLPLDSSVGVAAPDHQVVDALALDIALCELEVVDPQQARIVELRFFGGLTVEETAELLAVSASTVKRDWAVARAWLYRALERGTPDPPQPGD